MDTRTTSADFYPGGKTPVTAGGGITSGEGEAYNGEQRVPITSIEGLPERFTEDDMKSKIDDICKVLRTGGLALAAILSFPAWGADGITVHGTRKDRIYNDGFVVTNVTADLKVLTTNDVCNIVTNEVASGWTITADDPDISLDGWYVELGYVMQLPAMIRHPRWFIKCDDGAYLKTNGFLEDATVLESEAERLIDSNKNGVFDEGEEVITFNVRAERRESSNALGLAMAKDLEKLPDHETVTNVARAVSNSFWDEKNEVLWRMEFRDGEPMFVPVTNENVKATGGVL